MAPEIVVQQAINGLVLGATYGLIAVGYTMVYGIIGMINFAHGEIYMVSAYLTAIFIATFQFFGLAYLPALLAAVLAATVLITALYGWFVERIAYRPLRQSTRLAPLITAIGVSLILQSYVRLSQGARSQGIPSLLQGSFTLNIGPHGGMIHITHVQFFIIVIAFLSMALLTFLMLKTPMGRACRATEQDLVMASLLGIPTDRAISTVFVIGAAMAAVAGVLVSLNYGSFDFHIGFITGIKAFTAAVLGGIGSLPGAMLGGLILGLAESFFSGFVNSDYKDVFAFSLLVLVLIFRPSGLLGQPQVAKV
ncbi:MAG: branched-chain amino acid ABC transporter permease LivH [Magnetococcales bacterium]|nr:branched-chain amino acid ABC transporter permease LivH [Magnetococcales bacterium]